MTPAGKEKMLKKICKGYLMDAWDCGNKEARRELNLSMDHQVNHDLFPFKMYRRRFLGDLTRKLKKAGVLPL